MLAACHPIDVLRCYAAGDLSDEVAEAVDSHLSNCSTCLELLNELSRQPDSLQAQLRDSSTNNLKREYVAERAKSSLVLEHQLGSELNGYRLLKELGRGGMGLVYLARHPRLDQEVALKVLRPGQISAPLMARFEAEQHTLASMNHPHIARVFDGGITSEGYPFLVMELLQGTAITRHCDDHRLTITERLALFSDICQAIQHAHQKGIIHRDIKPSNILVTEYDGRSVPKVIDFGVAKVMNDRSVAETMEGMVVGTPEYMSPEQANLSSKDVDTRSDIYALGVLLYELLTGETPFHQSMKRSTPLLEIFRVIREEDPLAPSSRLSSVDTVAEVAAQRATEPGRLVRHLRGELDWIVLKCLHKEPAQRYPTATALADDIHRFLQNAPITASPSSLSYRPRKFVRRNRLAVVASALVLLTLLAGVVGTTIGLVHASHAKSVAENALNAEKSARARTLAALRSLTDRVMERHLSQQVTLSEEDRRFFKSIIGEYRAFTGIHAEDEESRAIQAEGYLRVGSLQKKLGENQEAMASLTQSYDLLKSLIAAFPQNGDYRQLLAGASIERGGLLGKLGKWTDAVTDFQFAITLDTQLETEQPFSASITSQLTSGYVGLGNLLSENGRHQEAVAEYQRGMETARKLTHHAPQHAAYRVTLADLHNNLGVVYRRLQKPQDAQAEYQQALKLVAQVVVENPREPAYRVTLSLLQVNLAKLLYDQGKYANAETISRAVLNIDKQLAAEFPSVPSYRANLADGHNILGMTLERMKKLDDAESEYQSAVTLLRQLATDFPQVPAYLVSLGGSYCNVGVLLHSQGKQQQSIRWFDQAINTLIPVAQQEAQRMEAQQFLKKSHYARARALMDLKQYEKSLQDWDRTLELDPGLFAARVRRAKCLAHCAPPAAVAETERMVADAKPSDDVYYDFAKIYSISSIHVKDGAMRETYAAQAVAMLKQMQSSGYFQSVGRQKFFRKDRDFEPLHQRNDFKQLLSQMEAPPR